MKKNFYFIFWQKFKKGKVTGQIAILFTLSIAVIILFTVITINIGILSNKKVTVDIAADIGALSMAAQLGSQARYLSETVLDGSDDVCSIKIADWLDFLTIVLGPWAWGWNILLRALALYDFFQKRSNVSGKESESLNRDMSRLTQEQQIREQGMFTALRLVVNDPARVIDVNDVDEDERTDDKVSRLSSWYKQRLITLYKLEKGIIKDQEAFEKVEAFKAEIRAFNDQAKEFLGFLVTEFLPFAQTLEQAGIGVDLSFWEPGENFDFSQCPQEDSPDFNGGLNDFLKGYLSGPCDLCKDCSVRGASWGRACGDDCRAPYVLAQSPNDSVDIMRHRFGYSAISYDANGALSPILLDALGQPVLDANGNAIKILINSTGIIPKTDNFLARNSAELANASAFRSWEGIFYYQRYYLSPLFSGKKDNAKGGIFEELGNSSENPQITTPWNWWYNKAENNISVWDDLDSWLAEWNEVITQIKEKAPSFYSLHQTELENIGANIETFRNDVGGLDSQGGIRATIKTRMEELENLLFGHSEPPIKFEAFYGWKDNLGWHFVLAQTSDFIVPKLDDYSRDHFFYSEECWEIEYPYNNDVGYIPGMPYGDRDGSGEPNWGYNPVTMTVRRYDQQKDVSLMSGSLLWKFRYSPRQADVAGAPVFDEPATIDLNNADKKDVYGNNLAGGDGILTDEEIKDAGLSDKLTNLLKYYSIHGYAKAAYDYQTSASLVRDNYHWDYAGANRYENVGINIFQ